MKSKTNQDVVALGMEKRCRFAGFFVIFLSFDNSLTALLNRSRLLQTSAFGKSAVRIQDQEKKKRNDDGKAGEENASPDSDVMFAVAIGKLA